MTGGWRLYLLAAPATGPRRARDPPNRAWGSRIAKAEFLTGADFARAAAGSSGRLGKGREMRTRVVVLMLIVAGVALAAIVAFAASGANEPPASQLEALRAQVKTLEARVSALEKRLQTRFEHMRIPYSVTIPKAFPQAPSPLPKGWQQREVNGVPYYVVPVQHDLNEGLGPAK